MFYFTCNHGLTAMPPSNGCSCLVPSTPLFKDYSPVYSIPHRPAEVVQDHHYRVEQFILAYALRLAVNSSKVCYFVGCSVSPVTQFG